MVGEVNLESARSSPPITAPGRSCTSSSTSRSFRAIGERSGGRLAGVGVVEPRHAPAPHPLRRVRSPGPGRRRRALDLRGTPFLYAGEELGLEDVEVPPAKRVDPGGRDGCRAPIPWTAEPGHGWPRWTAWLPCPPNPETNNVATLRRDPASIHHLYRRLLAARRASPALHAGEWRLLDSPSHVLAYERRLGADWRRVVANYAEDDVVGIDWEDDWIVDVATSTDREGQPFDGRLTGLEAVVLRNAAAATSPGPQEASLG
jgi:alpha-glucosidase